MMLRPWMRFFSRKCPDVASQTLEFQIARLDPKPGDTLLVEARCDLTPEAAIDIRDHFKSIVPPDVKVVVIDRNLHLKLIAGTPESERQLDIFIARHGFTPAGERVPERLRVNDT